MLFSDQECPGISQWYGLRTQSAGHLACWPPLGDCLLYNWPHQPLGADIRHYMWTPQTQIRHVTVRICPLSPHQAVDFISTGKNFWPSQKGLKLIAGKFESCTTTLNSKLSPNNPLAVSLIAFRRVIRMSVKSINWIKMEFLNTLLSRKHLLKV